MGAEGEQPAGVEETKREGAAAPEAEAAISMAISEAQFLSWKRRKDEISAERKAEASRKREEDIASGIVQMNGRELFTHEPWVFDNSCY